jgi:hypothetical protein
MCQPPATLPTGRDSGQDGVRATGGVPMTHPHNDVEIRGRRVLRGPNLYAYMPVPEVIRAIGCDEPSRSPGAWCGPGDEAA